MDGNTWPTPIPIASLLSLVVDIVFRKNMIKVLPAESVILDNNTALTFLNESGSAAFYMIFMRWVDDR